MISEIKETWKQAGYFVGLFEGSVVTYLGVHPFMLFAGSCIGSVIIAGAKKIRKEDN